MLIPVEYGLIVNMDAIRSLRMVLGNANRGERCEIAFTDGTREIVNRRLEEIESFCGSIIPAPPGYQVIRAFTPEADDEPTDFMLLPVIGFRTTDQEPMPITPFDPLGETWALVWPDGRCDERWNRLWPNIEAYKASFGPKGVRS